MSMIPESCDTGGEGVIQCRDLIPTGLYEAYEPIHWFNNPLFLVGSILHPS